MTVIGENITASCLSKISSDRGWQLAVLTDHVVLLYMVIGVHAAMETDKCACPNR